MSWLPMPWRETTKEAAWIGSLAFCVLYLMFGIPSYVLLLPAEPAVGTVLIAIYLTAAVATVAAGIALPYRCLELGAHVRWLRPDPELDAELLAELPRLPADQARQKLWYWQAQYSWVGAPLVAMFLATLVCIVQMVQVWYLVLVTQVTDQRVFYCAATLLLTVVATGCTRHYWRLWQLRRQCPASDRI